MRHPLLLSLLLIAISATSWWLTQSDPEKPEDQALTTTQRQVDYYLRGLSVTTLGEDGKPARKLSASEIRHYPDDDTAQLFEPNYKVFASAAPNWQVNAVKGWVSGDGQLVLLEQQVHISREADANHPALEIDTERLRIQPAQDYAETDEKVSVRSNQDWLRATGMQAWLSEPARIKFLDQVKAFYASH